MKISRFKVGLFAGLVMAILGGLAGVIFAATADASDNMASYGSTIPTSDDDFDRLDTTGPSGKRVNVIEWEGNLEIHVYPKGSLTGLSLKLVKTKGQTVMVIGYRFDTAPNQTLTRRALVSIPFGEIFKAYKDPTADDYDKIIITNNTLAGGVIPYKYDEPKQLYPDGHPALMTDQSGKNNPSRTPAAAPQPEKKPDTFDQESGSIRPFAF